VLNAPQDECIANNSNMMRALIKKMVSGKTALYKVVKSGNSVVLTFDDGPHIENTKKIISILGQEKIKAVFFMIGREMEKYPELVRLAVENGHVVAGHGYSHELITKENISTELDKTNEIIAKITRVRSSLFRPPRGKVTLKLLHYCRARKTKIILWSLDSEDYRIKDSEELIARMAKRRISPGEIILFHDDYSQTVEALPRIIANIKARGFSFTAVKEFVS